MEVISYKDEETADNNANYFLIQMKEPLKELVWNNWKAITIKKDNSIFFEFEKEKNRDFGSIFYCFDPLNVSSTDELNFNNLKKCKNEALKDKFLVISTSLDLKKNGLLFNKKFNEWHTNKPSILIEVILYGSTSIEKRNAEVLKIFHKEYRPTENSNS